MSDRPARYEPGSKAGTGWRAGARRGIIALGFLAAITPAAGQSEVPEDPRLRTIRESFERNVDSELYCRKDAKGDDAESPDRWITELRTCLGRLGSLERWSLEYQKVEGDLKKRIGELQSDLELLTARVSSLEEELEACRGRDVPSTPVAPATPVAPLTPVAPPAEVGGMSARIEVLERELVTCQARKSLPGPEDPGSLEYKALRNRIGDLEAELVLARNGNDRLRERLRDLGFPPEPGFAFAGTGTSAMTSAQVERDGLPGTGRRLTPSDCPAALNWLLAQPNWDFPRLWVFADGATRLCERTAAGDRVVEPQERTEAHAIVVR